MIIASRESFRNTQLNYKRMERTLLRHKHKQHPRDPREVEGIRQRFLDPNVMEKYGYNLEGDARFYIGTELEEDYAFTIFASKYVIDFIQDHIMPNRRKFLMDGTFDSLPSNYYQLLVISIEHQNDVSRLTILSCLSVRSCFACEKI